jgi:hypothetical protein
MCIRIETQNVVMEVTENFSCCHRMFYDMALQQVASWMHAVHKLILSSPHECFHSPKHVLKLYSCCKVVPNFVEETMRSGY